MADKQQNVKVVWNVDTSQLEKSAQLANQAQAAADKFHKSASQGAKTASGDLNKLVADEKRLEAAIKSTHVSQFKNYKDFVKNLQQLSKQYSDVKIKIDFMNKALAEQAKEQKKVSDATKQTAQSTQNLSNQFGTLYTGIKAVLAAGMIRWAVSTTLEMAKLSGNVEGVERAFNRAFPDGELLLSNLQKATHGAVSEFELMQRTLQATNLGVAVESLPVLFEFAAARAQQTGESVDYLVDSIVRGIGRKSILVLDNLGLSATRLREQFNGASLASQSVADVTRGVAAIAKVELEKMGGYAETSATKVDQLTVSWKELNEEVSTFATQEGGAVDFLKSYVDTYKLLFEALNKGVSVQDLANQKRLEEFAIMNINAMMTNLATASKEEQIKAIEDEIAAVTKSLGSYSRFREQMNQNIEAIKKEYEGRWLLSGVMKQEIAQTERIRDAKKEDALVDQEIIKLLYTKLAALKEVKGVQEQIGLIEAKQNEIESVEDLIKAAKSTEEIHRLNIELSRLNGELADLKAFGTTKQLLEVEGRVKFVPIEDYKIKQYKIQTENAVGALEIKTKLVLGTSQDPNVGIKQTQDELQRMLDQMRLTIPAPAPSSTGVTPMSEWEKIGQEFADNWQDILNQGIGDTANILDASVQKEADAYDAKINQARMYYDELTILAGDNEKEKDRLRLREMREITRLRREAFEADKRAKRSQAVINGAAGVVNAFATLPYPAALVASLLIAAQTASQIAIINSETPRFKDGVIDLKGPGTKRSDSIPARLSKGESVMTADETIGARGILEDIRSGRLNDRVLAKTIDNKVLQGLKLSGNGVSVVGMDDTRIVKEIHSLKGSLEGFEEKHGQLWKYTKKSETMKQYVRAKSF